MLRGPEQDGDRWGLAGNCEDFAIAVSETVALGPGARRALA